MKTIFNIFFFLLISQQLVFAQSTSSFYKGYTIYTDIFQKYPCNEVTFETPKSIVLSFDSECKSVIKCDSIGTFSIFIRNSKNNSILDTFNVFVTDSIIIHVSLANYKLSHFNKIISFDSLIIDNNSVISIANFKISIFEKGNKNNTLKIMNNVSNVFSKTNKEIITNLAHNDKVVFDTIYIRYKFGYFLSKNKISFILP